jgi:hypothetical protein
MKRLRQITLAVCALLSTSTPAYCWDKYAHILIAEIAYEHMTPAARRAVDSILADLRRDPHVDGLEAKYKPYNIVTVSAWMDDMRMSKFDTAPGHTSEFNTWHYVDLPDTPVTVAQMHADFGKASDPNVYEVLTDKCLPAMRDPHASTADRARYLAMFFHLAGDIHQPLHCIGRQKGGNTYKIAPLPDYDNSPSAWHIENLHAFWDNAYRYDGIAPSPALPSREGAKDPMIRVVCPYLDMPRTMEPGDTEIRTVARTLILPYLPTDKALLTDLDPADWAIESHDAATSFAFPKDNPPALSAAYVHEAHVIACTRMALAGWRMAQILNAIYR